MPSIPRLAALLAAAVCSAAAPPVLARPRPPEGRTTAPSRADIYRADLAALVEQFPRLHIDPFTKISREDWLAAAAAFEARIPQVGSDAEFIVGLQQLVALIGDGHSSVVPVRQKFREYPLTLHMFPEGPVVLAAGRPHADLIGRRLVRIGDTPVDAAAARLATVFAAENDSSRKVLLASAMVSAETLHALGLAEAPDRARFAFSDESGNETEVELSPAGPRPVRWVARPDPDDRSLPVSRQRRPGYYWSQSLPEHKAVYVCYVSCREDRSRPFAEFAAQVLGAIDAEGAQRVIIDLRRNGGGDSSVMRPLIDGLTQRPHARERGRVLVLIGRKTFSSAMLNAKELRDRCGAVLLGEPTGQKPNALGEVRSFVLPGTGVIVRYSTRRFITEPDADPPSMMPDVPVEATAADHFAGRDPVMDAALAWSPGP